MAIVFLFLQHEKENIDELRQTVLNKVREMYQIRYPYKAEFFF